jgi:hypothetical protein
MLRTINKSEVTLDFWGFSLEPREIKYITEQEYDRNKKLMSTGIKAGWLSVAKVPDNVESVEVTETEPKKTRKSKKGNN